MPDKVMTELKPCPFCGTEWQPFVRSRSNGAYWEVVCMDDNCNVTLSADTREEAIAAWNRRAQQG